MVNLVRLIFAVLTIAFLVVLLKDLKHAKETGILEKEEEGFKKAGVIGFVANFIDALGIGAFAPIVAMSKFAKMKLKNKEIPALLNIGCCIPVMTEAFIFTTTIKVDPTTLVVMLAAAGLGSYVGAGIISKMDEKKVQLVMGIALFITAILMFLGLPWIDLLPGGGNRTKRSKISNRCSWKLYTRFSYDCWNRIICTMYGACILPWNVCKSFIPYNDGILCSTYASS